jgi:phosphoribosylaminoimidazole-succinocarboxamide synthase
MANALPHVFSGKVRDIYDAGDGLWLLVASDRISAWDVVMDEPVPDKGRVLTAMSAFWFDHLAGVSGNHLVSTDLADCPPEAAARSEWAGRVMLCRRAEMVPVECVVRGYLTGSAWKEYRAEGTMHGVALPPGMQESERLPEPVFTPAIKAEAGDHDENISFEQAVDIVGRGMAEALRDVSLACYQKGADWAAERGIIIADTKIELGFAGPDRGLVLADEVLTPDSSRFWPAETWQPGHAQFAFDKQYLRDWAASSGWNKQPPAPEIPPQVVEATRARYIEAYERLTGETWLGGASA